MACTFRHCPKCVMHIYYTTCTCIRPRCVPNLIKKCFSPQFFCHNMPLPVTMAMHVNSATVEKCVLHIYTPRQISVPNFMRIVQKLRKKFATQDFHPIFCHNMPLPWQHTFCHCQKMCLAHLHPKANICAKFHENCSKTEEEVCDARFSPNFLP